MYKNLIAITCQDDNEWRKLRNEAIGGSDAAAVLNISPYKGALALWMEKTGQLTPDDISSKESVRLGNELEDYVARRFSEATGKRIRRRNATLKNPDLPFAHANVDRLVVGEDAGLECKTTSSIDPFDEKNIPATYYCQCVHYMMVTGAKCWYLAVLFMGHRPEFRYYTIERDEDEIRALADAEAAFWDAVTNNTPVAAGGSDGDCEALAEKYPGDNSLEPVDLEPVVVSLAALVQLKAQKKALDNSIKEAENKIKQCMGDSTRGSAGSFRVTWKPTTTERFCLDDFKADHPEIDLSEYYKTTVTRRFTLKEVS